MLTKKQTTTLILFAQNYSLPTIAKKRGVSLSTIRECIRSISKRYFKEFNNALTLRETYKRNRDAVKNPARCSDFLLFGDNYQALLDWLLATGQIKDVF